MPKDKAKLVISEYEEVEETRVGAANGGQLTNDTPQHETQKMVTGKRARGKVTFTDGGESRELGRFDISFPAGAKPKEITDKVVSEVGRMAVDHGLGSLTPEPPK